eukprot:Platyproteum_vivax@DN793_c0_g1_i2.p1
MPFVRHEFVFGLLGSKKLIFSPLLFQVNKDGKLVCIHKGCNATYYESDNQPGCCRHHSGEPVFRDIKKSWTCCGVSSYDWDLFLKLPTCTTGEHSPKMVDV